MVGQTLGLVSKIVIWSRCLGKEDKNGDLSVLPFIAVPFQLHLHFSVSTANHP